MAEDQQCSICGSYLYGVAYSYTEDGGYRCVRHVATFDKLRRLTIALRANKKALESNKLEYHNLIAMGSDLSTMYGEEVQRLSKTGEIPHPDYDTLSNVDGGGTHDQT